MDKGLETAYFYLGSVLYEQARYEEAVGALKEALRMNQTASDTHFLLAMTFKKLDEQGGYRDELAVDALRSTPTCPRRTTRWARCFSRRRTSPVPPSPSAAR